MNLEELKEVLPKGTQLIIANDEGKPISQEVIGEYKQESTFEKRFYQLQEENELIYEEYREEYTAVRNETRYPSYRLREDFKSIGWKFYSLFLNEKGYKEAARMLLHFVIWSHYWRAREDLETSKNSRTETRKIAGKMYFRGYKLEIDHYTRN